jgi:hypothetical protein
MAPSCHDFEEISPFSMFFTRCSRELLKPEVNTFFLYT